jgi:hypothetical protein
MNREDVEKELNEIDYPLTYSGFLISTAIPIILFILLTYINNLSWKVGLWYCVGASIVSALFWILFPCKKGDY